MRRAVRRGKIGDRVVSGGRARVQGPRRAGALIRMIAPMSQPSTPEGPAREDRKVFQYVGFRLEDTDYGVAITRIREIILMRPVTRVPQVPDYIEGLINLRGSVIP